MPSWATPWRARKRPSNRRGPKIAVVGNCQAEGVAEILRLLLPDARVETLLLARLEPRFGNMERLAGHLREADYVFSHVFWLWFFPGGNAHDLQGMVPGLRLFPTVVFPAFHPDVIYVGDVASLRLSKLVHGPLGPSHSAIALFAYLEGLSVERALSLYTDAGFERLGYYRAWEEGRANLMASAAQAGFALDSDLARWARRGCFMHDSNHPKLHVLADIARRLAVDSGLQPLPVAADDYLPDRLVDEAVWPVYPAIAERYGVASAPLFRAKPIKGRPPRLFTLRDYVERSFASYAGQPRERLSSARIEAWRADPGIRELFASARGA